DLAALLREATAEGGVSDRRAQDPARLLQGWDLRCSPRYSGARTRLCASATDGVGPPVGEDRQRLLDSEEHPLDVDVNHLVEGPLRDRRERGQRGDTGVGEQDVEAALRLLHGGEQQAATARATR